MDALRLLPSLTPAEPRARRVTGWLLALAFAAIYLAGLIAFTAPAHNGVDQNGYLVGGKMIADHGSTALRTASDLDFVGRMWVRAPDGSYHPKYPAGLPLAYAVCLWVGGPALCHYVSPIATAFTLVATFALVRRLAGSFLALVGVLLVAFSQLTLYAALNPNSHATALACVTGGAALLLGWWQTGRAWRGLLGGFLLGFAVTVRYTDGLLALTIAVASLAVLRPTQWKSWLWASVPTLGWLVPVGALAAYNWLHFRSWTGYDTTNEAVGFSLDYFRANWELAVRKVHDVGGFFVVPLGVAGIALMATRRVALALFFAAWAVPSVLLYAAYYWAPESGMGYTRFFTTVVPAFATPACWLVAQLAPVAADAPTPWFRRELAHARVALLGGLVAALACGISLYRQLGGDGITTPLGAGLDNDFRGRTNLALLGDAAVDKIPADALVVSEDNVMHHLQLVGDWRLIDASWFNERGRGRQTRGDREGAGEDDPDPFQPERRARAQAFFEGKDQRALNEAFKTLVAEAKRPVYVVLPDGNAGRFVRERLGSSTAYTTVDRVVELPRVSTPLDARDPSQATLTVNRGGRGGRDAWRNGWGPNDGEPRRWAIVRVDPPRADATAAATPTPAEGG